MSCGRYREYVIVVGIRSIVEHACYSSHPSHHLIPFLFFFHRPAPSPWFSLACLLDLIPRPRAWEAPTNRRSAIAGGISICLLSIMPCRSLAAARSLLPPRHRSPRHRLPDAIASVPSVPSAASSSPRHHHLVITPAGHILPASRPASLVEERGGDTGRLRAAGCSDVIASLLAYPMPFPRLGRFGSHPSHPRRLVRFASMHVPTEVRSAAVRMPCGRLCLLPRLSVSIVFKMFSCQSFKILRLFGIARLGEYRRRSCPIASPSHLRFASAVSG